MEPGSFATPGASGAMPTIVLFIDVLGGSACGPSCLAPSFAPSFVPSPSAVPQEPQRWASGLWSDPQRGQTIMGRAYHVEVAARPEFEYPCGGPRREGTTLGRPGP